MKSEHKWLIVIPSLTALFILSFSAVASVEYFSCDEDSGSLKYDVDRVFLGQVTQIIVVANPNPEEIKGGKLCVPLIKNETFHNYVLSLNFTSEKMLPEFLEDNSGNRYVTWSDVTIGSKQEFIVGIDYCVLSFGIHNLVEGGNIGDCYMNSELFEKYTSPESLIQSDDRSIVLEAQSLTRDVENSHEKISRIFEHVVSHMQYVSQDYERGALWALENGTGDCSEYSYLFVALCRAAGIPARVKTGFAFHYDNEKLEEGHMWAEYYLEGYGWVQVDPAWNIFDGIDERHFDSLQGTPEYIPYANYFFNYTTGPDEVAVKDSETIQIRTFSAISFNGSLVSNVIQAVQTINQGEQAVFVEKLLGMPMLFSAEAQDAEHALFESRIHLQNALGNWEGDPEAVQSAILESISDGEVTVHTALALVGYAFTISISVLLAVLLAALFLMKRRHLKAEHYSSETKASYD